jgi:TolB-like protein
VVAVMPFEDLSGRVDVGEVFTRVFLAELVRSGSAEVVDPGSLSEAVERLQIRTTVAMTRAEMKSLADSLPCTHLLFGTVLDAGTVRVADGDLPSVAATLRLVEASTGRIVWACEHSRTGEDNETLFGWGREHSRDRLLSKLAVEMITEFRRSATSRRHSAAPTPTVTDSTKASTPPAANLESPAAERSGP